MEGKRFGWVEILAIKVLIAVAFFILGVSVGAVGMHNFYKWKIRNAVDVGGMVVDGKVYDIRERVVNAR